MSVLAQRSRNSLFFLTLHSFHLWSTFFLVPGGLLRLSGRKIPVSFPFLADLISFTFCLTCMYTYATETCTNPSNLPIATSLSVYVSACLSVHPLHVDSA